MRPFYYLLLPLLILFTSVAGAVGSRSLPRGTNIPTQPPVASSSVGSMCSQARYPDLCIRTLAPAHSGAKTTSLESLTKSATTAALRSAYRLTKDRSASVCSQLLADAAVKLDGTVKAIANLPAANRQYMSRLIDCRTWASAALTDVDMCIQMLNGGGIVAKVTETSQLASNALYLITRLTSASAGRHH